MRVQCASCHGAGGWMDRIDMYGGPVEPCGCCNGTGRTSRQMNMFLARWERDPHWSPSEKALAAHEAAMKEEA